MAAAHVAATALAPAHVAQAREPPPSVPLCTEDAQISEPGLLVALRHSVLSADEALAAVASNGAGATSMFVGEWHRGGCKAMINVCLLTSSSSAFSPRNLVSTSKGTTRDNFDGERPAMSVYML